jgi:hypothetical protein
MQLRKHPSRYLRMQHPQ